MAKPEKKEKISPEQLEEQERAECLREVQAVLEKYSFAMIPYNQPTFKLQKVQLENVEEKSN